MKLILRFLKYLFFAAVLIIIIPYLTCPFYKYPDLQPFSGNLFYNPYEKLDSNAWRKANFHTHTRQWIGITAGSTNRVEEVVKKYREIKYDIIGISDYQSINRFLESEPSFIPVYEHGYNAYKSHQLVIGAKDVNWIDYLLFQSFHNLQDVIRNLKKDNAVISVNHPKLRNAYSTENLKYLRDYDLLEIANHSYFNAADVWDTVLSNGNCVFALANDDNHDINDPQDYGYVFNMINSHKPEKEEVISALRYGRSFAVELEPQNDSSPQNKIRQANMIPVITSCKIFTDTLEMRFNKDFDTLKLVGQYGIIKKIEHHNDTIRYVIQPDDTYIRAEINQGNKSNVFLNPVLRFNGELNRTSAETDTQKTWFYRIIYLLIAAAITIMYFRIRK